MLSRHAERLFTSLFCSLFLFITPSSLLHTYINCYVYLLSSKGGICKSWTRVRPPIDIAAVTAAVVAAVAVVVVVVVVFVVVVVVVTTAAATISP